MKGQSFFQWLVSEPRDRALPLTDHLVELRRRLLWSLAAGLGATVACSFYTGHFFAWLSKAVGPLVFLSPAGAFMARFQMALALGLFLSAPIMLYHVWRFVSVALSVHEKWAVMSVLPVSYMLFASGVCLGWFFVLPVGLKFLVALGTSTLQPMMSVESVLSFSLWTCLGLGLLFQLPVILVSLARWGVIQPESLARHRRTAVLLILLAAGLVTPGPDIASQLFLAAPTYLLYEISIWIATWKKSRAKPAP